MKQLLPIAFVVSGLTACSSAAIPDAGYCPPGQEMYMPQLCKMNDPCNIGNSIHIGAWCTQNGNQCAQYNLTCGIDADPVEGSNFCVKLCAKNADCGENACCTGDPLGVHPADQRACVPTSCPNPICDGG
jgi:hypothetical protein